MRKFLLNPKDFVPTDVAKRTAYVDLVVRKYDKGIVKRPLTATVCRFEREPATTHDGEIVNQADVLFQSEIRNDEIDWDRLRNVRVEVDYDYSSTMGRECAVVVINAEARKDNSSYWEEGRSGGIAFSLEDWVQKK